MSGCENGHCEIQLYGIIDQMRTSEPTATCAICVPAKKKKSALLA